MIGYLDELGRGWIKGGQHTIRYNCYPQNLSIMSENEDCFIFRFLSTFNQCYIFDEHGRMKMWYWNESSSYSLFLPLIFKLERCLNVCYNNQVVYVSIFQYMWLECTLDNVRTFWLNKKRIFLFFILYTDWYISDFICATKATEISCDKKSKRGTSVWNL